MTSIASATQLRASRRPASLAGLGALGFLSILLVAGCGGGEEPGLLASPSGPADVVVSESTSAPTRESFPATLVADREARIATRISGRIREIPVDVGSAVRAGQPVVILEDQDVRARVEGARAQAELARRSFQRIDNLARDGAASQQELDEARARLEAAEAGLRDATTQLDYVVVRAPFSGYVAARMAEPGDLTAPGRPLITLIGTTDLEVQADLPGDKAGWISEGDRVRVEIPGTGVTAPARVVRVAPVLRPGSRRLRVEAVFDPPLPVRGGVVPGQYARIVLEGPGSGSLWIPEDAVVRRGQLTGVFTLEGEELRLRWLRLGRTRDGAVEVLSGPATTGRGLTVVRSPGPTLRDGQASGRVERRSWTVSVDGMEGTTGSTGTEGAGR